jgi:hypothetical protein
MTSIFILVQAHSIYTLWSRVKSPLWSRVKTVEPALIRNANKQSRQAKQRQC